MNIKLFDVKNFFSTFVIAPWILWVLFGALLTAFVAQYAILNYHWKQYAFPDERLNRMRQAYIVGAIAFIALMLYAIMNANV
ncbi:MAG TPA: hypothetical protein VMC43_02890 [Candidatus Paceibacterota bacterium]|nr:hypothetical protein [Candidatus Paceibacterota bacterium]